MLTINPAPKGFVSTATKDIFSDNTGQEVTTERLVASAKRVHKLFQEKGYYNVIKESSLFTKGNANGK